jgi:hypothetical protein
MFGKSVEGEEAFNKCIKDIIYGLHDELIMVRI